MQPFSERPRRCRPRLAASALVLTFAGGVGAADAAETASRLENGPSAVPAPCLPFAGTRHRPWRHHVYQRAWSGTAQQAG